MKKFLLLMASGLLAANFAGPARAADFTDYGAPKMGHNQDKLKMGWHRMTGIVEDIDYITGMLTLKSGKADMKLHFPPASIKDLKNGDTITTELGFVMVDGTKKMPKKTE